MTPRIGNFAETFIKYSFWYAMFFGLSTHLYDRQARRLVYSPRAFVYSIALHVSEVMLFPSAIKLFLNRQREESRKLYLVSKFFFVILALNLLAVFVGIGTQWTTRLRAPKLFEEILKLWHRHLAHQQSSAQIRRTAGKLCVLKAVATLLIMANTAVSNFFSMDKSAVSLAACFHVWMLMNIVVVIQYLFGVGLVFAVYLFDILNWNLSRIVRDINDLSGTYSSRSARRLSRELLEIGQLHRRLRKWVVSYKNLFELEILVILLVFFISQVCILFLLLRSTVLLWRASFHSLHLQLLLGLGSIFFITLDYLLIFYICGRVIYSCSKAGQILRDLPARRLPSKLLERTIEMVCFELQRDKMRLSICGLADLDGNTGFAMMEAAMMHIILLVQIDYDQFAGS